MPDSVYAADIAIFAVYTMLQQATAQKDAPNSTLETNFHTPLPCLHTVL